MRWSNKKKWRLPASRKSVSERSARDCHIDCFTESLLLPTDLWSCTFYIYFFVRIWFGERWHKILVKKKFFQATAILHLGSPLYPCVCDIVDSLDSKSSKYYTMPVLNQSHHMDSTWHCITLFFTSYHLLRRKWWWDAGVSTAVINMSRRGRVYFLFYLILREADWMTASFMTDWRRS